MCARTHARTCAAQEELAELSRHYAAQKQLLDNAQDELHRHVQSHKDRERELFTKVVMQNEMPLRAVHAARRARGHACAARTLSKHQPPHQSLYTLN